MRAVREAMVVPDSYARLFQPNDGLVGARLQQVYIQQPPRRLQPPAGYVTLKRANESARSFQKSQGLQSPFKNPSDTAITASRYCAIGFAETPYTETLSEIAPREGRISWLERG
jgi:hypothetical protein